MSHTNGAVNMPNGFESVVTSEQGQIAPVECVERRFYVGMVCFHSL